MIQFSCPGCQATFRLPDEMAGKSARCSKCNHRFTVPGAKPAPAPAPPPPPPAKKVALNPVPEVMEAEIVDDDLPPPPPPRRPADEVEVIDEPLDEDYDRPRRRRRRDDDYEEEYDDRPRRRRRKKAGALGWVLATVGGISFVLAIVFFVLMMVSGGGGGGGGPIAVNNPQFAGDGNFVDMNNLGPFDPMDKQWRRSRAKLYRMELEAGKAYIIELQSGAFDAYIRVEDANGQVLAQDDDGGAGLNSRLFFIPPRTETYTLVATSLNARMGPYRFSVTRQGP